MCIVQVWGKCSTSPALGGPSNPLLLKGWLELAQMSWYSSACLDTGRFIKVFRVCFFSSVHFTSTEWSEELDVLFLYMLVR